MATEAPKSGRPASGNSETPVFQASIACGSGSRVDWNSQVDKQARQAVSRGIDRRWESSARRPAVAAWRGTASAEGCAARPAVEGQGAVVEGAMPPRTGTY